MWLVLAAMRRPVTILVAVLSLAMCAALAVVRMKADIFPDLGSPTIFVSQPYGGLDPSQMEGFVTYYYEYHFLYITGIEHVESKTIQGVALMKLVFHPGTPMDQAMAQVVGYVNRARSFMPPGTVPPFITRFDAGSVPIGQLVFSSPIRSPGEMQDIAINRVRPLFATLPGVSAPPPFGGNQRTIVVRLNPDRLRSYKISPEEAVQAVNKSTAVLPSGNVRIGDLNRIASTNATVGSNLQELMGAPVRTGEGPTVYLRDIAVVENGTDIVTGYAHVNGRRTVYIPVTKRSDASTLDVIRRVRAALPTMRKAVPEDVDIRLEFDQSGWVTRALVGLVAEGVLGALLTGLMVLLFLRDWRSGVIVVTTIPFSILAAVVWLWALGQTINIMTLGGLALAVGVLVDESTVVIESIHTHLASGLATARAVVESSRKTAVPRLLAMACILAVFVPSFFMTGVARQLFVPLSLAVGFAMVSSYLLSSTIVPVLSTWMMHGGHEATARGFLGRLQSAYTIYLRKALRYRWWVLGAYGLGAVVILGLLLPHLGTEIFPTVDSGQYQLRLRAPTGTRIERTEVMTLKALDVLREEVGADNVQITSAFIGVQPSSYPINTIYLWTSGPHEAVLQVALKASARLRGEALKERLRSRLAQELPGTSASFEAGDIVSQVMSFGSPTPVEVAVEGPSLPADRAHAAKILAELGKIGALRDLQYSQALDYPSLEITIDRDRAGQYGLTAASVARSLVAATSSSRFIEPNYWRDPAGGNGFQIQVEIPQHRMASLEDVRDLPVMARGESHPLLGEVATLGFGTTTGVVERRNMQRVVSLTANVHGKALGTVAAEIEAAVRRAGEPPRGVTVAIRGQIPPLVETISGLRVGLLASIVVILLLLAASFQSFRLSVAVVAVIPAVLCGVTIMLWVTGTTLNVQSFMGAIMATGIAVANAILLLTFAEASRAAGSRADEAGVEGGRGRLRAVLMTAMAMMAGMVPMALGIGEGAEQTAPLGRAVIGGLAAATVATLTVLPILYAVLQQGRRVQSLSLDPDDPRSRFHESN
jgi:multidrug efflux pump subunit AcrB